MFLTVEIRKKRFLALDFIKLLNHLLNMATIYNVLQAHSVDISIRVKFDRRCFLDASLLNENTCLQRNFLKPSEKNTIELVHLSALTSYLLGQETSYAVQNENGVEKKGRYEEYTYQTARMNDPTLINKNWGSKKNLIVLCSEVF